MTIFKHNGIFIVLIGDREFRHSNRLVAMRMALKEVYSAI